MPIYEYGCEDCGERFEVTQKITDNPLETCSKCNGKIKRLVSATAFHLKGTGWYKTDYASTNKESEKKEQAGATGKDEKKKEGTAEPKKPAEPKKTEKASASK